MSQMSLFIILTYHIVITTITNANNITCTESTPCQNSILSCSPKEDCFVNCDGAQSCLESTINCPLSGDCNIYCSGGQSCRYTTINGTLSDGDMNLLCMDSTDHCRSMKVYGSTLENNTGDLSIVCDGKLRGCVDSEIYCPFNGDCFVQCLSDSSCRHSQIMGPTDGDLNIDCFGIKSCFDGIFNASMSERLDISGCIEEDSCLDLSIYCPPHGSNMTTNCFVQGNDNLGKHNGGGTKIYAVNGWKDIDIDYTGTWMTSKHDGTMFCGESYNISCDIAINDWSCSQETDFCNNVDQTLPPTSSPTIYPTISKLWIDDLFGTTKDQQIETSNNMNNNNETILVQTNNIQNVMYKLPRIFLYILVTVAVISLLFVIIVCVKCGKHCRNKAKQRKNKDKVHRESDPNMNDSNSDLQLAMMTTMVHLSGSSDEPGHHQRKIHAMDNMMRNMEMELDDDMDDDDIIGIGRNAEGTSLVSNQTHIMSNKKRQSVDSFTVSTHAYNYQHRPTLDHYLSAPSAISRSLKQLQQKQNQINHKFNNKDNKHKYSTDSGCDHHGRQTSNVSLASNEFIVQSDSIHEITKTPHPPPRQVSNNNNNNRQHASTLIVEKLNEELSPLQSIQSKMSDDSDIIPSVNTMDQIQVEDLASLPHDSADHDECKGSDTESEMYRIMPPPPLTPTAEPKHD